MEPRSRGSIRFSLKKGFSKARLDSRLRWERGIWCIRNSALFPSIHPKDEETIIDDEWKRERGTFNAGQTSVTRVGGGRARMGTFTVNFDGLCNPL